MESDNQSEENKPIDPRTNDDPVAEKAAKLIAALAKEAMEKTGVDEKTAKRAAADVIDKLRKAGNN